MFFEYRADFVGHTMMSVISLLVMYFIWSAIFRERVLFKGYTFQGMLTYVLITRFLHFVQRGNIAREIAAEIKDGRLSVYLIKPLSYLKWWFSVFLANRFFEFWVRLAFVALFFIVMPKIFLLPNLANFGLFLSVLVFSLLINFSINLLMALATFWIIDIRLFRSTLMMIIDFFAGALIPLDIMPPALKTIGYLLPFQFTTFFPIKVYQGGLNSQELVWGMSKALIWITVFFIVISRLWVKGLKRYEAVGQ